MRKSMTISGVFLLICSFLVFGLLSYTLLCHRSTSREVKKGTT